MFCWTLHQSVPTTLHYSQAVAFQRQVYAFGGSSKAKQLEVNVFNTVSLCWRKLTPGTRPGTGEERHLEAPPHVWRHTAVLITDTVYLWGGVGYRDFCNVLYAFDIDAHTWFKPKVSGNIPEARMYHSACVFREIMIIHGGRTKRFIITNDTYKLDTSTMVWTLIHTRGIEPPHSRSHSATIIGTKMFVFGGYRHYYANSIRVFDTETNLWLDTPSAQLGPEGRWCHSAFTCNGEMNIFGGSNAKYLNDLWNFSPETFSWKKVEPKWKGPPPTEDMCCCMVGERVFLFGGVNTANDLYILDLSPSLKTLCKLAVIQYGLDQSGLPHDIRWELAALTNNSK